MKFDFVKDFLEKAAGENLKRSLRDIMPFSGRECLIKGQKFLNFSSNNYLGLSNSPELREESIKWIEKYGSGSGASRLVTGTSGAVTRLEQEIAAWKGKEAALILGSGYMANCGILPALSHRKTVIFADKLNHASLNAGCNLSPAEFVRFRHNDLDHLEWLLNKYSGAERKIIADETVFSMDGDISDFGRLSDIAEKYGAFLYLDDAHGTGVFGYNGEGLASGDTCDISMGTFSKAMGGYGAYVACSSELREFLINKCAPFIYSTAPPPAVYGAVSASVRLMRTKKYRKVRTRLLESATSLRGELKNNGFNTAESRSQIIPVIIGDSSDALKISEYLYGKGILAVAIRPPTVPAGTARIRISLTSEHTGEDISYLFENLKEATERILS